MATQVYRVTQVLTAAGSPVARLQGMNEEGHEARLELPTQLVQRAAPGHVLVLQWSLERRGRAPAHGHNTARLADATRARPQRRVQQAPGQAPDERIET